MLIYLSGAIEYAPNGGTEWRAAITPVLRACGHEVYDPARDEKKNLSDEELKNFRSWKRADLPRFQHTIRKIIEYDLDLVERGCDAILAYWDDYATQGAGSHGELTVAHRRGIPVYLVLGMPVERVSGWILGCASHVFCSFAEAEEFFQQNRCDLLIATNPATGRSVPGVAGDRGVGGDGVIL